MSYDLFDFAFHNNYIINKNPDIAVVRGTQKHFVSLPPFFNRKQKYGSTLVWGTYNPRQKY